MTDKPEISVIVPAFNEQEHIYAVCSRILKVIENLEAPAELIVVDDGSTDGTVAEVNLFGGSVKLVRHRQNCGYGAALKTGLEVAQGDTIVICDADGTYSAEDIPKLIAALEDCDMVVGDRSKAAAGRLGLRYMVRRFLTKVAERLSKARVPDLNSGMRAFRKNSIRKFLALLPDGFSFTTTITMAVLSDGQFVRWVDIEYASRGNQSKFRPIADTYNLFLLLIRTIVYFYPLRVLVPLSLVLFAAALFVLLYSKLVLGEVMDVTTTVLFMLGLNMAMLGVLADLIVRRTKGMDN